MFKIRAVLSYLAEFSGCWRHWLLMLLDCIVYYQLFLLVTKVRTFGHPKINNLDRYPILEHFYNFHHQLRLVHIIFRLRASFLLVLFYDQGYAKDMKLWLVVEWPLFILCENICIIRKTKTLVKCTGPPSPSRTLREGPTFARKLPK